MLSLGASACWASSAWRAGAARAGGGAEPGAIGSGLASGPACAAKTCITHSPGGDSDGAITEANENAPAQRIPPTRSTLQLRYGVTGRRPRCRREGPLGWTELALGG